MDSSLITHHSSLLNPSERVTFSFEGRAIAAVAGQSIGAALYAAGVRIFSRSFKYHRPRGLLCVAGECPNCLMQVDGRPNVRVCVEPARQGQIVVHQNAWPSLGFDVLRVFDKLDRFLPVGFYYKRFHKPRWLWPIFEHTVRHIAGLGRIDVHSVPEENAEAEHLHTEVCVIGGGPAGLAAAAEAANAGASVLLLERQPFLGGWCPEANGPTHEPAKRLTAHPRIDVSCSTHAFGLYEGNLIGAFQGERLLKIRAKQIIVCTGSRERPFVFHNNDLPGVFLSRGVQRLVKLYGVPAGRRAVVLTDNDEGLLFAHGLKRWDIEVAAVVDRRPAENLRGSEPWNQFPALKVARGLVLAARGGNRLRAVGIAQEKEDGSVNPSSVQEIACDLLCMAGEPVPANELLLQGGMRFRSDKGCWQVERAVPGLWAAGGAAGTRAPEARVLEGRLRGAEATAALGYPVAGFDHLRQQWQAFSNTGGALGPTTLCPQERERDRKRFVCLCEDVTEKDLHQAIAEGFDHIETLKRYSTVTMGPCQGKVCSHAAVEICARTTSREIAAIGTTTARPPAVPVEMGLLAATSHHPVRRTPLHHSHEAAGAQWMDAGQWKRPESYGDPAGEVRAVRGGVGLIDVGTLGKLELIGPDSAELLERVYLNKWSDLKIGRTRYGAMCTEEGILFDDGVGAHLPARSASEVDRFYLTATTGNAELVFQWLEQWRVTWRLNVTVLNQTSAIAAMNVAGPRARDVLSKLTELDVSPAAFPYLAMREADVAGVACKLMRIGFVGELGYEIHCPSSQAWHLWEAIWEAGKELGLRRFGVEAQRILRLEKGHIIIGQDTDALSSPLEAGLEWMVRFEKPFFHGREPLLRLKERGPRSRLVGFHMLDTARVPEEGCQVVEQGRPVGRVTSARFSPTLNRSLGLAWVPAGKSAVGGRFLIRWNGTDVPAIIAPTPFYDPEGKRMKA
ncbi:MAG TPA: FAD-dependent oxidoreductase [Gemmataceae bacterium]|nr:FAD-dependent oxidoreductase [Gemmataceae bacterium]